MQKNKLNKQYKLNEAGELNVNALTGALIHHINLTSICENALSLPLSVVFNTDLLNENSLELPPVHMASGWKTNFHQFLLKEEFDENEKSKKVIYIDGYGNKHEFFEKWYYEENDEKIYVNKEIVVLDENRKLKVFNTNKEVKYEIINEEGYQLLTLDGLAGYNFANNNEMELKFYVKVGDEKLYLVDKTSNNVKGNSYDIPVFKYNEKYIEYNKIHKESNLYFDEQGNQLDLLYENKDVLIDNDGYKFLLTKNPQLTYEKVFYELSIKTLRKPNEYYEDETINNVENSIRMYEETLKNARLNAQSILENLKLVSDQIDANYGDLQIANEMDEILYDINELQDSLTEKKLDIENSCISALYKNEILQMQDNTSTPFNPDTYAFDSGNVQSKEIIHQVLVRENNRFDTLIECSQSYEHIYTCFNMMMQIMNTDKQTQIHELEKQYRLKSSSRNFLNKQNTSSNLTEQYTMVALKVKEAYEQVKQYIVELDTLYKTKEYLIKQQKLLVCDLIIDQNNNSLGFDGYGRLVSIKDKYENEIKVEYGQYKDKDKIMQVFSNKHKLKFVYDEECDLLKEIIEDSGKTIKFSYNDDKELVSIKHKTGQEITFSKLNENLTVIKDSYKNEFRYLFTTHIDEIVNIKSG